MVVDSNDAIEALLVELDFMLNDQTFLPYKRPNQFRKLLIELIGIFSFCFHVREISDFL